MTKVWKLTIAKVAAATMAYGCGGDPQQDKPSDGGADAVADTSARTDGPEPNAPDADAGNDASSLGDGDSGAPGPADVEAGSPRVTNTYLATGILVPPFDDEGRYAPDYSDDGESDGVDNSMRALNEAFYFLGEYAESYRAAVETYGEPLFALRLLANADLIDDAEPVVTGFLASIPGGAPEFDGTDQPAEFSDPRTVAFSDPALSAAHLSAGPSDFVLPLLIHRAEPVLLELTSARVQADVTAGATLTRASLSGTIDRYEFARHASEIAEALNAWIGEAYAATGEGAPVPCDDPSDCAAPALCPGLDANGNGVADFGEIYGAYCIDADAYWEAWNVVMATDADPSGNYDGYLDVEWDDQERAFTVNENALMFTLDSSGTPVGFVGDLFHLDTNGDGIRDAMGLGFGLEMVSTAGNSTMGGGSADADADGGAPDAADGGGAWLCASECGSPGCGDCPTKSMVAIGIGDGSRAIDATEVTNAEYAAFLAVDPDPMAPAFVDPWFTGDTSQECEWNTSFVPANWPPANADFPVSNVDWCDAAAYCVWAQKWLCGSPDPVPILGYSDDGETNLVDRSEWYNACTGGAQGKPYPYFGNDYQPLACNGTDYELGRNGKVAVQTAPCEGAHQGLFDMSGNVTEWTNSCAWVGGTACGHRGGSFVSGATALTCDHLVHDHPSFKAGRLGFRCCGPAP